MRSKSFFAIMSMLVSILTIFPATPAKASDPVWIINVIDWIGASLYAENSVMSQTIKVNSIPDIKDAETHFAINIGNSSSVLSPHFLISNRNVAEFSMFDVGVDTQFINSSNNTKCNLYPSGTASATPLFNAVCTTTLQIVAGETYTVEIMRKPASQGVSMTAFLTIKSSKQILNLGTINFSATQDMINRSSSLLAFNQTSIFGTNLTCNSNYGFGVVYSPLLNNGTAMKNTQLRSGNVCPNFLPIAQSDGNFKVDFGKSTSNSEFTCPPIEDLTPTLPQPKVTGFLFTGTNQKYIRYQDGTQNQVSTESSLIGCYGDLSGIARGENIGWQYGVINRDANGFYWKNGAGIRWGLTLDPSGQSLTTDKNNPYYSTGNKFNLEGVLASPTSVSNANTESTLNTSISKKPAAPTFKGFNIVGNNLNLTLNIGSGTNKPDNVYLIAPNLGINVATDGQIGNGIATFTVPLSANLFGSAVDLNFFSVKNGINSDNMNTTINLPSATNKQKVVNKSVPLPAVSPKYVVGALLVNVTAKTQPKAGASAVAGYLVANKLGITSSNPIVGRISNGTIAFGIPLSPTLAGKTVTAQIYLTNEIGDSKPVNVDIKFPGASAQTLPTNKVDTVICKKGNQVRTFVGKKCPPGWK